MRLWCFRSLCELLDLDHVLRPQPFWALLHVELNLVAFGEGPEALGLNRGLMYENVASGIAAHKPIALFVVEPPYDTLLSHQYLLQIAR